MWKACPSLPCTVSGEDTAMGAVTAACSARASEVCGMEPPCPPVKAERQGTPRLYCEFWGCSPATHPTPRKLPCLGTGACPGRPLTYHSTQPFYSPSPVTGSLSGELVLLPAAPPCPDPPWPWVFGKGPSPLLSLVLTAASGSSGAGKGGGRPLLRSYCCLCPPGC